MEMSFSVLVIVLGTICHYSDAWGGSDKVDLNDLKVLTLYHGQMTTARRSSPIPQMKCVGGTAGCSSFQPQVVQCYNRGSDGYDVQWECKTDIDNAYRFGRVEVSCEGYDYPDDPYILKGSCGLEYTLDLTKEGHAQKQHGQDHSYYGDSGHSYSSSYNSNKGNSIFGDLITLVIIGIIIYAIYRTCIAGGHQGDPGDNYPTGPDQGFRSRQPPPPGFRDDFMPRGGGCSSTYNGTGASTHAPNTGGGFWTGAATGGLLGYLFGNRGNTGYYGGYQRPYNRWGSGWGTGTGWGGGMGGGWGGATRTTTFSSGPSSSGTRTASGFGGTRRR